MAYGYNGKILRADLSSGKLSVEEYDDQWYRTYMGGRGFNAYFLMKEVGNEVDALDPANRLIFSPGPITGAPLSGSGRSSVGARSPLTGAYGEGDVGGFFGAELKHAGFDAIVVQGKAEKPVYLWVRDGQAEIRDASHLWGLNTLESQEQIREELGDKNIRTAQIGPGGEKLVRYACVINDLKHSAGRTGMGAVMGSKNLKAVATRGRGGPKFADPETIRKWSKWIAENMMEEVGGLHKHGTSGGVPSLNEDGGLPTRNFQEGRFEHFANISGETMANTILVARENCYACVVRCKRAVKVDELGVIPIYGGPEYETVASLGSLLGIGDLKAVAKANQLCNAYSLDTIATGTAIAWAMEAFEKGILTAADTDGIELRFGNAEAMLQMIEKIARREGFGNLLAEGCYRASKEIGKGSEEFAMQVKGQEFPMHEPRIKQGLGLGYSLSPTGADHVHNIHDTTMTEGPSMVGVRELGVLRPLAFDDLGPDKVRYYAYSVNWASLVNCLGMCIFLPYKRDAMVEIVNAVTGWKTNMWELMKIGERMNTLCRAFNAKMGFAAKDDTLPERFFHDFAQKLPTTAALKKEEWEAAKKMYYVAMGWDDNGVPQPDKLRELALGWAAE